MPRKSKDRGPLLTTAQAAARWGVTPGTFRGYVARGHAPAPDVPAPEGVSPNRSNPLWYADTLDSFPRPGRGARTDLSTGTTNRKAHS